MFRKVKIADIGRNELTNDLGLISKRVPDWLVKMPSMMAEPHQAPARSQHRVPGKRGAQVQGFVTQTEGSLEN